MKVNKWKLVKLIVGFALLFFLVGFSSIRNTEREVSELKINIVNYAANNKFINDSLVKNIINGRNSLIKGVNLGGLDIFEIEKTLLANPFIKKAEVYKDARGILHLDLLQKTPMVRISTDREEYYLTEEGTKLPLSKVYSAEVILATGNIKKEDYLPLVEIVKFINDDNLLKSDIIALKKGHGNSYNLVVNKGDYTIEFGELKDFEEKFNKLKIFYKQYLGKVGLNYYDKINLKYKNQVVATKRVEDEK